MAILEALVEVGSPIAFQLRDDFVAPTARAQDRCSIQMNESEAL